MKKKFLSLMLLATMLITSTTGAVTVKADEGEGEGAATEPGIVQVTGDETNNELTQNIEVTANKGPSFVVSLPAEVTLESEVTKPVYGAIYADFAADKELVIEPIDSNMNTYRTDFIMENVVSEGFTAKDPVEGEIILAKTLWGHDDTDFCETVEDLADPTKAVLLFNMHVKVPTGKWEGRLPIRIALEEKPTFRLGYTRFYMDIDHIGNIIATSTEDGSDVANTLTWTCDNANVRLEYGYFEVLDKSAVVPGDVINFTVTDGVTTYNSTITVVDIQINPAEITMGAGETQTVEVKVLPESLGIDVYNLSLGNPSEGGITQERTDGGVIITTDDTLTTAGSSRSYRYFSAYEDMHVTFNQ